MQKGSDDQELNSLRASIEILKSILDQQNQRKVSLLNELQNLQERIRKEGADSKVHQFVSLLEKLKTMERQESEIQSDFDAKRSSLEAKVSDLEENLANGSDSETLSHGLDDSINESLEKLNSAKKELAARLRAIVSVKRQLDDVPSQSELIQYEHRFSELNAHIQFQDAIASTAGRMKLLESMEGIVKGSQQKLEKVQLGLQEEQKVSDALKDRYTAAVMEQRRCYSLLKAFQEECARNERLRRQTSA
ncbi:coiled-coil domain-containing protein 93 isoform X3 [Durio zibethinus]|uniref:Coiled-coil domain-containing protein 93 isoform X3 n=1 Tax=Durio zibethinus TaxID=66656 RepID=A0A6P5ZAX6_DURZI|nr:coiled-coil domain-containing protein 93 isoform X3 [Durio zibethinus]